MNYPISRYISLLFALLFSMVSSVAQSAAPAGTTDIAVVYFSAKDCGWCAWWEGSRSMLESRFRESDEFKKLTFFSVKTERLADSYGPEHFPAEIKWVWQQLQEGTIKTPERPEWHVFIGHQRVGVFYGAKDWEIKAFPFIKAVVAKSSDERLAMLRP